MKSWVLFATVVLICQAAKVPQEATHEVTMPVPSEVLTAPPPLPTSDSKRPAKTVNPAKVVEASKDHEKQKVMTTVQPKTKPMTSTVVEMKRNTRAVPFTDNKSLKHSEMNVMKDMWQQRKHTMTHKMPSHRSMRSVQVGITTKQPVTVQPVTENPVVAKSSDNFSSSTLSAMSTIDPCEVLCTKFEFEPICATNGLCLHDFPNQCILESYNCKHPKGKFSATKDNRCQMSWLNKCDESEML